MKLTQVVPTLPAALACCLGASAQAQGSNWSITYAYQGTSSIQHNGGQVQEGSTGDGSFGAAQTLGAGGPWVIAGEFESKITVKAQWIGLGDPPAEQEFRIDSSTSSHGSASFAGSASNGLSSPSVSTDPTTLLCSGTSYVVSRPDAMGVCLMRFSVSGSASAIPVPFPGGWVLAATSNTLTVAPDHHAAMWRYQFEPTYYRMEQANGNGVLMSCDTDDTQHRLAVTTFLPQYSTPLYTYNRVVFFDTYGFAPWPLSSFNLSLSGPATILNHSDHFIEMDGFVSESDLAAMVDGNQCKTVTATGTVTDNLSPVTRSASLEVRFYPPYTIVRRYPWVQVYRFDANDKSTWNRLTGELEVDKTKVSLTLDRGLAESTAYSVTNGYTMGISLAFPFDPFEAALRGDFSSTYGVTAQVAKNWSAQYTWNFEPDPKGKYYAWIVGNPYWRERNVLCATYGDDGYGGDFNVTETSWYSPSKAAAESMDMLVAEDRRYPAEGR